ncbi:hypothetical protein FACS1894181_06310 [Bacteroidia bacterium]|nr:hypothetical protein FACS1894181_06310 [Bacteroidia bacterium]
MKVYHGSYTKIEEIDLSQSKLNKDFGQGFYVTKFRQHADSWAKVIGRRYQTKGFVTEFLYYNSEFTERLCKVKHFDSYSDEWIDFVIENRNPMGVSHNFDIVEGPVANDTVQNRIFDYLNGLISKVDFLEELKWHEETHQICFCTVKSLLALQHSDKKQVSTFAHIGEPLVEQLMLDLQIDEEKAADKFYSSATFGRLANIETKLYEKPWQEIYQMLKQELKSEHA